MAIFCDRILQLIITTLKPVKFSFTDTI